jgi:serine/threonine protein kinase
MERADFDLSRLKDKPIEMRLELCLDACLSLNSLHKLSIAHRDIKPSNYLVFKENHQLTVKLSDFGCARLYNDASSEEGMTVTGAIGSGNYRSPEVLFPTYQGEDFRCQDIWSFCLLLLELLFDFPVESRPFSMLIPIINREKRDITFSDLNRVMDQGLNLKLFDGGEILFGLILQGLRYHVKNRIANLDLLQKYLIQYRGYQKKFCRFKNSQFRFELQLLAEVDNIADVF